MIQRKPTKWRIDWRGAGSPAPGQLVRHVTPTGKCSFARVLTVRVIRNIRPLPDDVQCRYLVTVDRSIPVAAGASADWTCHAYPRRPSIDPETSRWSPLR
ncbi:hypothetical protein FHW84_001810 [Dyella sp. SG562]|uniref:hypothetical protein n=1 Tax=Dyella sp. SG562 TaxID=2587017 RepID=UPI00141F5624|nr:hypothetical protein [Dyella sp. SG562]NII73241.1 hypothetical protein [Dyella sp. SG562]